jgi:hypothetical protein
VAPPFGPANPPSSGGPGLEGESTTVLRPGDAGGNRGSADGDPTQAVRGDEPTAAVGPQDDEDQRTQVIRPAANDDRPTERWH